MSETTKLFGEDGLVTEECYKQFINLDRVELSKILISLARVVLLNSETYLKNCIDIGMLYGPNKLEYILNDNNATKFIDERILNANQDDRGQSWQNSTEE